MCNVGIGKEAARQLAAIDSVEKVLLACRSKAKAEAAMADLEKATGKKIFQVVVVDTSDLASVRKAVASVDAIDGLIMNAGGPLGLDLTSDGVTMSFAANVLGHVVLTEDADQIRSQYTCENPENFVENDLPTFDDKEGSFFLYAAYDSTSLQFP